jgi:NAD(P)-dependent dehydrogenase (short-subunit alcohol dehydrogenase family)
MALPSSLAGRVAIVTGAGKGIGRACAIELAARGANVIVNNRRHSGEADEATSAHQTTGIIQRARGVAQPNYERVDDMGAGQRIVDHALRAYGRIDIVVANAAVPQACTFHKQTLDEFLGIFNVGFLGALQLLHAAWPLMRAQQYGRAVVMTSSAGRYGNHGLGAYSASKAAIEMLMRSLAAEAQKMDIRVNAVSPYAFTQMTASYLPDEVGRCLTPTAIAPLVGWLSSADCTSNGEVLVAGGGRYRRAYSVETDSLDAGDFETLLTHLRSIPGRAHPSSNHAFSSLVKELRQGGQIPSSAHEDSSC